MPCLVLVPICGCTPDLWALIFIYWFYIIGIPIDIKSRKIFIGPSINNIQNKIIEKTKSIDEFINKIINGDSEKILKEIPPNSIDLTVTSPPYDDIRDYKGYNFNDTAQKNVPLRMSLNISIYIKIPAVIISSSNNFINVLLYTRYNHGICI